MDLSRKSCRVCLSEDEFNVSLFGNYCQKVNMVEKVFVCLKIVIKEADLLNTICYKCAENVERYFEFISFVKKCQNKLAEPRKETLKRHVTSYVREQVFDADYTFSFLDAPEEKDEKFSSPFFSYFSPPNMMMKSEVDHVWKTPSLAKERRDDRKRKLNPERPRQHSRDLFDSQSQDAEETEMKSLDWKLTPDDSIIKRVRDKCFGRSDY